MDSDAFDVLIEPGGVALRVPRDANVLGVALAAGLPLPHSCRAGRCASCKSRLLSGRVEYPDGVPPGITATNPPDAPPTHPFEMYPSAFLPPFHYVHPVTGQRIEWTPPADSE